MQKLRVVRVNGQPIGWLESSVRNILRAVDMLLGIWPLGLLVMFLSQRSQRLGDYAAGTVVIVERRQKVPTGRMRLPRGAELKLPDMELHLSALEPKQYQLLRSFLHRRDELNERDRRQLARLLAHRLKERWGVFPNPDIPDESFLEEVVSVYERSKKAI